MLLESGPDVSRAINRPNSWYDRQLVTARGEKILAEYDTEGIQEIRRIGAVWSGRQDKSLQIQQVDTDTGVGHLTAKTDHPYKLRLFVLSLLWRSAATELEEFQNVQMSSEDLEYLRDLVVSGQSGRSDEFPTVFLCLRGPGLEHNHTPVRQKYESESSRLEIYRFYFDGLIILVGDKNAPDEFAREMKSYLVGFQNEFFMMARPFKGSRQERDLLDVMIGEVGPLPPAGRTASNVIES
ncbi:MAG: hypothetical protein ABJG86_14395 [Nitratireductor sp.]